MSRVEVRKGMPDVQLTRAEFERRFQTAKPRARVDRLRVTGRSVNLRTVPRSSDS